MIRLPHPPRRTLPAGSWDTHAHVFGPSDRFPPRTETAYAPPDAPAACHRAMLSAVGAAYGVLVQPAVYGDDHSALINALAASHGSIVGVGSAPAGTAFEVLDRLYAAGVRGLRFVEARDPGGGRYRGTIGFDALPHLAPAMREIGLHAELWAPARAILDATSMLSAAGVPIVLDHMGGAQAARGMDDPDIRALLACIADQGFWVKLTACRASSEWPDYRDLPAIHAAIIAAAPDRTIWGSDWPHVRMAERSPDIGHLIDLFDAWTAGDHAIRSAIFVTNPARLYATGPATTEGNQLWKASVSARKPASSPSCSIARRSTR